MSACDAAFGCAIKVDSNTIAYAIGNGATSRASLDEFLPIASNGAVWWTTIESGDWRKMGWPITAWRDTRFIEPGINHIAEEAGCRGMDIPIFMVRLVTRMRDIVRQRFNVKLEECASLTDGLQSALIKNDQEIIEPTPEYLRPWHQCSFPTLLQIADRPAECGPSARVVRQQFRFGNDSGRCKRFGINRGRALKNLLEQHAPSMTSQWTHYEVINQSLWNSMLSGYVTGVVKVRVERLVATDECKKLLPLRRRRLSMPAFDVREMASEFWVSNLEAVMLATSGDVFPIEAWIATETISVKDLLSRPISMMERDNLSITADILWENILCAISRINMPGGVLRPSLVPKGESRVIQGWQPHTAWLNASLRAETLLASMLLAQKGINIMAHDTTGVWIAAEHRDDCEMADEACAETGMVCGNDAWNAL